MYTVHERLKKNYFIKFLSPLPLKKYFLFLSFFLSLSPASLLSSSFLLIFFFSPSSTLCFADLHWASLSRASLIKSLPSCRWWVAVTPRIAIAPPLDGLPSHRGSPSCRWMDRRLAADGSPSCRDGSRRATRWIAAVPLGRSPLCLPSLGGSWSLVARFCGGFGCGWVWVWMSL